MTAAIELRDATKRFRTPSGAVHTALRDLNLVVQPGEFRAVVGPTGCGKSTTLSLVSGLEPPSAGEVLVDGAPVTGIGRGIAFMFQTDAVFPWKSVLANVAAGPLFRGVPKRQAIENARDWLRRVGLSGFPDRAGPRRSGSPRGSSSCTTTSGSRCATRSSSPMPVPPPPRKGIQP